MGKIHSRPVIKTSTKSGKVIPVKKKVVKNFFKLNKPSRIADDEAIIVFLVIIANSIQFSYLNKEYITKVTRKNTTFINCKAFTVESALQMFNIEEFGDGIPDLLFRLENTEECPNCCGITEIGGFDFDVFHRRLFDILMHSNDLEELIQGLILDLEQTLDNYDDCETPDYDSYEHFKEFFEELANIHQDDVREGGLLHFTLNDKQRSKYSGTVYNNFFELLESDNYSGNYVEFENPNSGNTVTSYNVVREDIISILRDFIVEF